jgi:hypothetical protein
MIEDNTYTLYYDLESKPCNYAKYSKILESKDRFIAVNYTDKYKISTVWLGQPHSGEGLKNIFETMIFPLNEKNKIDYYYDTLNGYDWHIERYDTIEEALKGHANLMKDVRLTKKIKK